MTALQSRITRLRLLTGLDFHVLGTLLSRGWSVVAGAATVILLPQFLTSTQQGFYYTFSSLLGLQILFELGLGQVIIQLVGHEIAHLKPTEDQRLEGDAARHDRLASLVKLLRRWYIATAVLFGVAGGVAGALFLAHRSPLPILEWLGVWCVMVMCTAINLTYVPPLAMLEGFGRVGQVARLRLRQAIVGYLALWAALVFGAGLWSACMVPVAGTLLTAFWLRGNGKIYQGLLSRAVLDGQQIAWRRDVLPFQWRIALSALSGYFIFYSFTPLIFANRGAVEAGRFGMAMTIFNALAQVGTSWIYAKTPMFAMHISRGERAELNRLFLGVFKRSFIFTVLAVSAIVIGDVVLTGAGVRQMSRIAAPGVMACLALVCVANCVIFSFAAYMRAHREEPMLFVSVAGGIATGFVAYFGSRVSVLTMSMMYAALTACVLLPWTAALFLRYYRRMH